MNPVPLPNQILDSTRPFKLTISLLTECRISTVIKLLEADPARALTPEALAHQIGISVVKLRKDFKKCQGVPLAHFRLEKSLQEAHRLIATEFLTVTQAMKRTGFHHINRFDQRFFEAYGINPGELRKQCLQSKFSNTL